MIAQGNHGPLNHRRKNFEAVPFTKTHLDFHKFYFLVFTHHKDTGGLPLTFHQRF